MKLIKGKPMREYEFWMQFKILKSKLEQNLPGVKSCKFIICLYAFTYSSIYSTAVPEPDRLCVCSITQTVNPGSPLHTR